MGIFEELGYVGMCLAAFLAGSVFPFSSEAVMTALLIAELSPWKLFLWGTVGNVAGSMLNYGIGRLGRLEWIEKYLRVKREKIESTQRFLSGHGAWMGLLCFVPVLGSAIAVTLGFMRSNIWITLASVAIGKAIRYALLIMAVEGII
ncbi:MAG: DedA family protein [Bacteroidaceae bacterium]|nr:DedA family protein [Bacteroidaceae bacterium]